MRPVPLIIALAFTLLGTAMADTGKLVECNYDRRLRIWRGFPAAPAADEIHFASTADTPLGLAISDDARTLHVSMLRGIVLRYEAR